MFNAYKLSYVMKMEITKKQNTEIGMIAAGICLALAVTRHQWDFAGWALVLLLVSLVLPVLFFPITWCWWQVARLLAAVNMRILLTLLFFILVVPVGLWRRWRGRDSLRLRAFRQDKGSALQVREHVYTKEDLVHTF